MIAPSSNLIDHWLYGEADFHTLLHVETKRAERAHRSCLLMLLDVSRFDRHEVTQIASDLILVTRETDIKGWLQEGSVLGVLFCEMGSLNDWVPAREAIANKIRDALGLTETAVSWHLISPSTRTQTRSHEGSP